MHGKINKSTIDKLKHGDILADTEVKGFVARRLPSGVVTYGYRYRIAGNTQRWLALGVHGRVTPDKARRLAKQRAGEVASDRDPHAEREAERTKVKAAKASTTNALLDTFLERHVRRYLRTAGEVERVFNVYVRPRIGAVSIYELQRRHIVEMLDAIEDDHGSVMADRTLAYLRKAFNWHAARDDRFNTPIVKGMARTKPAERARERMLDDQEIRDVWAALDTANVPRCYPAFIRTLLLTGQRLEEVAGMPWKEIEGDTWIIPAERRKKGGANAVPLTKQVLLQLGSPLARGFVFTTTGGAKPFSGFSKAKRSLDKTIAELRKKDRREPMPHWQLHDLRRTARSLMSRSGVSADIGERVVGHVIPGVRGVYDRHAYLDEKRNALERLASLVASILDPSSITSLTSNRHAVGDGLALCQRRPGVDEGDVVGPIEGQ